MYVCMLTNQYQVQTHYSSTDTIQLCHLSQFAFHDSVQQLISTNKSQLQPIDKLPLSQYYHQSNEYRENRDLPEINR